VNAEGAWIVVGAGPAGAAAAGCLARTGRKVVVLDTGLSLEPEREQARLRMSTTPPERWRAEDVSLTSFSPSGSEGPNYKQLFGSDVAFRDDDVLEMRVDPRVGARPSYAVGGLSNVWGSGLLTYTREDLAGWPIGLEQLAEGYRAVLGFLPYAAEHDELAERYPLYRDPDGPLLRTRAGEEILARLRRRSSRLDAAGVAFGAPRLAVRVGHPAPTHGCVYCNHCLDGCPYGHIYSAAHTIGRLAEEGAIEYRPGLHVERIQEGPDGVTVQARSVGGGPGATLTAERVMLAAGVIPTTVILQASGLLPPRCEIRDSQALYLPFAWLGRVGRPGREPGHTLSQAALVVDDPAGVDRPVHVSLYTHSDGITQRVRREHPWIARTLGPGLERILRRLVVGICFFHSDDSDAVACSWDEHGRRVTLDPVPNPARRAAVSRFQRSLLRSLGGAGLVPLAPLAEVAPPGGGYHYGGSAPMRSQPTFGETDTLGRPAGARAIHVVDASCFPAVPGGSITLTAMANAHRIAAAVAAGAGARAGAGEPA